MTPAGFNLLLAALDADRDAAGRKYEDLRQGLICFFRWRGGMFAEDHADETINRVARKLAAGETIRDPLTYVHGVARLLLLEVFKERERERQAWERGPRLATSTLPQTEEFDDIDDMEERLECLRACLAELPAESRDFMKQYYSGAKGIKIENRRRLAARLRIPINALRLRARRLRSKLEICIEACLTKGTSQ